MDSYFIFLKWVGIYFIILPLILMLLIAGIYRLLPKQLINLVSNKFSSFKTKSDIELLSLGYLLLLIISLLVALVLSGLKHSDVSNKILVFGGYVFGILIANGVVLSLVKILVKKDD